MINLSVIVLSYRSGAGIQPFIDGLDSLLSGMNISYEIVLVANDFADSDDDTQDIVKRIAEENKHVKPVTLVKEGMMGWDVIQGFKYAEGEVFCLIDGDGQFPIESIKSAYELLIKNNLDLVKTYRIKRYDGLTRLIMTRVYNIIFRVIFPGIKSKDINSKPKIIRSNVCRIMNLQSTDWFIDAEIMIKAKMMDLEIGEIPIIFHENTDRKSFVRFSAIFEFIRNMMVYRLKK